MRILTPVLLCDKSYNSMIKVMDMSEPLRALTPTLDAPVLRVLAGTAGEMTRQQVTRLVHDASEAGVRKVLRRLAGQGIVLERRIGTQYTYAANRDHLMWRAVDAAVTAGERLDGRIRTHIENWAVAPLSVQIFGSAATGSATGESDIDLLLYRSNLNAADQATWDEQTTALRAAIEQWTGNACEILEIDPPTLVDMAAEAEPVLGSSMRRIAGVRLEKATPSASLARTLRDTASSRARGTNWAKIPEVAKSVSPELRRTIEELFTSMNTTVPPQLAKAMRSQ
ncbi:nucleotidyltransferase domain-containing protein [Nocardioidaceae bacterium SCSIO 66511]|nr:nucleotidyltransferase domain-containing protein [Nocardioidaceae bacterium SCSIO 66511]